ncbi:hypothetical protein WJX77_009676 [Trebouxia sp. C0004]
MRLLIRAKRSELASIERAKQQLRLSQAFVDCEDPVQAVNHWFSDVLPQNTWSAWKKLSRQPLSNNTAVLNSGAASSVPKSGKKRKKTSEVSKAYIWIDEKFGRNLIKKDANFKQIYEDFVEGVIERVSDQSELNLPNLRTHIRKKFNHAQAAQGILFNDDGTRIGAADKAESDGEDKHADKDDGRSKTPATAAKANNDSSGSDDDA